MLAAQGWALFRPRIVCRSACPRWPRRSSTAASWRNRTTRTFTSHPWFLPKRFRPHFHSIYAYCRISDDLGDEVGSQAQALALLDIWQEQLDACYRGEAKHPVFVALRETIRICDIPKEPFADLLTAFRQDQRVARYASMADVLSIAATRRTLSGGWFFMRAATATRNASHCPMRPAPRCSLRISGRTFARILRAGGFIFRRMRCERHGG